MRPHAQNARQRLSIKGSVKAPPPDPSHPTAAIFSAYNAYFSAFLCIVFRLFRFFSLFIFCNAEIARRKEHTGSGCEQDAAVGDADADGGQNALYGHQHPGINEHPGGKMGIIHKLCPPPLLQYDYTAVRLDSIGGFYSPLC